MSQDKHSIFGTTGILLKFLNYTALQVLKLQESLLPLVVEEPVWVVEEDLFYQHAAHELQDGPVELGQHPQQQAYYVSSCLFNENVQFF